jgi:hypothetical protein
VTQQPPDPTSGSAPVPDGFGGMPAYGQGPVPGAGGWPTQPPVHGGPNGYGLPGYGPSGYGGWPAQPAPQNGLGLAAMICGIVGAVLGLIFIGIIPAVLGIIFGAIGLGRVRRGVATNRGQSLTGVITGIVGVLIAAAILTVGIISVNRPCDERYNTDSHAYQVCVDNNNN